MIERVAGWSWQLSREGIFLAPPDRRGVMFYAERVRPLRRIEGVLAHVAELFPTREPLRATRLERTITDEGEYALIATLASDAGPARTVGVVWCDDFYAVCVGMPSAAEHAALFEQQVRASIASDAHVLGVRRRRYLYAKPRGWHGLLEGPFHAAWYPLDFPANRSCLMMLPAIPTTDDIELETWLLDTMMTSSGGHVLARGSADAITTPSGLSGSWVGMSVKHSDGAELQHDLVALQDDRYLYAALLQSPPSAHGENLAIMRDVVRSIIPIPRTQSQRGKQTSIAWLAD